MYKRTNKQTKKLTQSKTTPALSQHRIQVLSAFAPLAMWCLCNTSLGAVNAQSFYFLFFSKNLLFCVDFHSLNPSQTNMPSRTQAIVQRSPFTYRYEKDRASILLHFQFKKITFHKLPSVLFGVVLGFSMS